MSDSPSLAFDQVAMLAGGARLFDNLSFALAAGEQLAIVGASGGGKSMIARLALGLSTPLSGTVRLFDTDLRTFDQARLRAARSRCGVAAQGGSLIGILSVEDNLWLGLGTAAAARARLRRKIDRILLEFQLEHVAAIPANALSTGECRRLELARAFIRDPELVILDEPLEGAAAVSEQLEAQIRRRTAARGRGLLLLTQNDRLAARLCSRVLRIEGNRVVQQVAVGGASPAKV